MKGPNYSNLNAFISILLITGFLLFAVSKTSIAGELKSLEKLVMLRTDIINAMIKDPKEASMKNWAVLGNPHDETELIFYINSISNGTKVAFNKDTPEWNDLLKHSRSNSGDETSIVLQNLRLSLMAYNVRPGDDPPLLKVLSLKQSGQNEVVVECLFMVNSPSGHRISRPASITYDRGDNPQKDLFLQKIIINENCVYGWWYNLK